VTKRSSKASYNTCRHSGLHCSRRLSSSSRRRPGSSLLCRGTERRASLRRIRSSTASGQSRARIEISYLARIMGTSVRELEDTYFRWLQRTDEQLRAALDAYDAKVSATR
jgi:hypothetical protein